MWPLTGRTSGRPAASSPCDAGQADPGRQDDVVRAEAAALGQDELGALVGRRVTVARSKATPPASQAASNAASRARLSTWWSPGTSMPPRMVGAERGHQAPARLDALRRCASSPSVCW